MLASWPLPLAAGLLLLGLLTAPATAAPAQSCAQQSSCLDFTYECAGSSYRVCMAVDTANPNCVVDDGCNTGVSHICVVSPSQNFAMTPATCASSTNNNCPSTGCKTAPDSSTSSKITDATSGTRICQLVAPGKSSSSESMDLPRHRHGRSKTYISCR